MTKPPMGTYSRAVRYGFWNRRGDYLTAHDYVVYAPQGRADPPELESYPTKGYVDHFGNFIKYDPTRKELPESLPRQGQPPVLPYDKVIKRFFIVTSVFVSDDIPTVRYVRVLVIHTAPAGDCPLRRRCIESN
jgi:hypothetical protein